MGVGVGVGGTGVGVGVGGTGVSVGGTGVLVAVGSGVEVAVGGTGVGVSVGVTRVGIGVLVGVGSGVGVAVGGTGVGVRVSKGSGVGSSSEVHAADPTANTAINAATTTTLLIRDNPAGPRCNSFMPITSPNDGRARSTDKPSLDKRHQLNPRPATRYEPERAPTSKMLPT